MKQNKSNQEVCSKDLRNEFKERFLSQVAHDLRSPLTIIKGSVGNFTLAAKDKPLSDVQKELLKILERNADRMQSLLEEFFSLMRLEVETSLVKNTITLQSLISEVVKSCEEKAKLRKIKVDVEIPKDVSEILADRAKLFLALKILLSYALEFSSQKVVFQIFDEKIDQQNVLKFCIIDDGESLSKSEINKIFKDSFEINRSIPDNSKIKKMAFELLLCKQVVLAHQGEIWAEPASQSGLASCFFIPIR